MAPRSVATESPSGSSSASTIQTILQASTTPPPSQDLLEYRLKKKNTYFSSANTWEQSDTCGWYADQYSSALSCTTDGYVCATNQNIVGCTSGLDQPFYTMCIPYPMIEDYCTGSVGSETLCYDQRDKPSCGSFVWVDEPTRYMVSCFAQSKSIDIKDKPKYVLDSEYSQSVASTQSSSDSDSITSPALTAITPVTTDSSPIETITSSNAAAADTSSLSTGAKAGIGAGASIAGLLLLGIAAYIFLKQRAKHNNQQEEGEGGSDDEDDEVNHHDHDRSQQQYQHQQYQQQQAVHDPLVYKEAELDASEHQQRDADYDADFEPEPEPYVVYRGAEEREAMAIAAGGLEYERQRYSWGHSWRHIEEETIDEEEEFDPDVGGSEIPVDMRGYGVGAQAELEGSPVHSPLYGPYYT